MTRSKTRAIIKAVTPPILLGLFRRAGAQSHRQAIGGAWDEIGQLQFDFLVDRGLKPDHRFLDVGCGSLRGGVHFIRYLEDGHYHGIDAQQWLLDAGLNVELPKAGVVGKTPHLLCRDDFDVSAFGTMFDYALAQSVFTHLPWNTIQRCLVNIRKALKPDGRFYATFFEDQHGDYRAAPQPHERGGRITYPDQDPFHYEFDVFVALAHRIGLDVEYIGDWNHPRDQMMMVFTQR